MRFWHARSTPVGAVSAIGYDKFGRRTYMKQGNGAETRYSYDSRRRLSRLGVTAAGADIINNRYSFDAVGNVTGVANIAPVSANGGQMSHTYGYDDLYRLTEATGTYSGQGAKSATYTLGMAYDNMHRIVSKSQKMGQTDIMADGALNVGYELDYTYQKNSPFRLGAVSDASWRTPHTSEGNRWESGHAYEYDAEGNLTRVVTSRVMADGHTNKVTAERRLLWDEEGRMTASSDNGLATPVFGCVRHRSIELDSLPSLARKVFTNYWYDADGERTVKSSGSGDHVFVNGTAEAGLTETQKFTLYVGPWLHNNYILIRLRCWPVW